MVAGETVSLSASTLGESADTANLTISEYDGLNELIKTSVSDKTITYSYNGDGLRTSKTVNGVTTKHVWDGSQMALELNGSGVVTNKYVRGINLLYAEGGAGTNRKYYLYNGHGDVKQLTGTDGNVTKTYEYDAFGNEKNIDNTDTNPFRYCGEYFDLSSDTYYLRARYYDPQIGRFVTEDSVKSKRINLLQKTGNKEFDAKYEIDDPLSLNLYCYSYNNPVLCFLRGTKENIVNSSKSV